MVRPGNNKDRCCWPGQAWSQSRATCIGVPKSCPSGAEIQGEACVVPPDAAAKKTAAAAAAANLAKAKKTFELGLIFRALLGTFAVQGRFFTVYDDCLGMPTGDAYSNGVLPIENRQNFEHGTISIDGGVAKRHCN